jgi:hypothetical protein
VVERRTGALNGNKVDHMMTGVGGLFELILVCKFDAHVTPPSDWGEPGAQSAANDQGLGPEPECVRDALRIIEQQF